MKSFDFRDQLQIQKVNSTNHREQSVWMYHQEAVICLQNEKKREENKKDKQRQKKDSLRQQGNVWNIWLHRHSGSSWSYSATQVEFDFRKLQIPFKKEHKTQLNFLDIEENFSKFKI